MFNSKTYKTRRQILKRNIGAGLIIFPGNDEYPVNYPANTYHFRQDSSFLYYFGIDIPGLYGVIDIDSGIDMVFGDDFTVADIIWMGNQPTIKSLASKSGISNTYPLSILAEKIEDTLKSGRKIHFLPQYQPRTLLKLGGLLGIRPDFVNNYISTKLIRAVVAQRIIKSKEEVREIEKALDISYEMYKYAMINIRPGIYEREIAGPMNGIAHSLGKGNSFTTIFSIHGETLHNHKYDNLMKVGDIVVCDSGAESFEYYASDITRTMPVSGRFTQKQSEIYNIVLNAQLTAIGAMKPGKKFRQIHLLAAKMIAEGLKGLGLMKGDIDDAVQQGAAALFFPHGLGHMLGLDVHDMEGLGENYVGYDDKVKRSSQFGLSYLRFAKELLPGHVITVEPGIYFIPALIDQWKSEKKFTQFINYDKVEKYRKFGGIRIEDDVLIEPKGCRVLGKPIPKTF
ncbi:MAG: aminopeptidase P family protein [Ignavibacteria bacterium]|nr:aminopeptidase P family protein [Ignavibacteria bacterium]